MWGIVAVPVAVADITTMLRVTASAMKRRLTVLGQWVDEESLIARPDHPYMRPYSCCKIA